MLAWSIRSTHRFCRLHILSWNSIYIKAMSTSVNNYQAQWSMARRASGKRWSVETEVRKRKYGSEKKSLSVFNALLTHKCVCWGLVDKRGLNLCDVKAGSSALGLRWTSLLQCACDSQTQTKTNGESMGQPCGLYAPVMSWQWCRCECCRSSSPMAQPAKNYSRDTSKLSP